jgi:hypothetical protein
MGLFGKKNMEANSMVQKAWKQNAASGSSPKKPF